MSLFKKKESTLDRRLKRIQDELQNLDKEMKTAGKARKPQPVEPPPVEVPEPEPPKVVAAPPAPVAPAARVAPGAPVRSEPGRFAVEAPRRPASKESDKLYEDRFADYFMASSFDASPTLRRERNVLRNRALLMLLVVAIMFIVLLIKFFNKSDSSEDKNARENLTWPEQESTIPKQ